MKNAKREIIGLVLLLEEVSNLVAFVRYSGHVKVLRVDIQDENKNTLLHENFYTDFKYMDDEQNYLKIKDFLQSEIDKATAII